MNKNLIYIAVLLALCSCSNQVDYDAYGRFEATSVVVSAEAAGEILHFDVEEGDLLQKGEALGLVDTLQLYLQRKQVEAQLKALLSSRPDVEKQVAALREEIKKQQFEQRRIENLLKDGAAPQKQADDVSAAISILQSKLEAALSSLNSSTATITGNASALEAQLSQLQNRIENSLIASPINGCVLMKYAQAGEYAVPGKALMKVADMEKIYLRAYFTSDQLSDLHVGDEVTVIADFGGEEQFEYEGQIRWIAQESEFTPKNIQTRNSRANLVYAVKIAVKNDGRLKIGLHGEVKLK